MAASSHEKVDALGAREVVEVAFCVREDRDRQLLRGEVNREAAWTTYAPARDSSASETNATHTSTRNASSPLE